MLAIDYHCHTNYSTDSKAPMESMVQRAIELGLEEIALTDHVDYQGDGTAFPHQIDYDDYVRTLEALKDKYSGKIRLTLGVEIGLGPHLVQQIESFTKSQAFEFIIGSSHDVGGVDLYWGNFFGNKSKREAFTLYFAEVLTNVKTFSDFCVYGHLDYLVRYSKYPDNELRYEEYKEKIDAILKALIERGKGLELNTSGYRYNLNQVHPKLEILKQYKALGGEIVTVGSDAHRPEDLYKNFKEAYALLEAAGFSSVFVYRDLKPLGIKI